jgi:SAM-dependent methyltransferase
VIRRFLEFNSSRKRLFLENKSFAEAVPAGSLVLDAGAGDAPYRSLFSHARYESADFLSSDRKYAEPTYECDLSAIPVGGGRFDFVVFNQVMEHLPEPGRVAGELFRVLKPSGKMIYTGPLFFEEHEQPYDFYRYTRFGVRHVFERAGFVVERVDWLEGFLEPQATCFPRWRGSCLGSPVRCAARERWLGCCARRCFA